MLAEISTRVRNANSIVFLTGAGVSAESGIPTFRDAQFGLWSNYRAEDLATQAAFSKDPNLVWDWYQWRRQLIADASANSAHLAITEFQRHYNKVTIITQNVDGLHQLAGAHDVIEFHGNIRNNKCNTCNYVQYNIDNTTSDIPECPRCKTYLRPAVVWFGEPIPEKASHASIQAVKVCDVLFSVGTSSQVHPAAGLAELARGNDALIIEINPNSTPLTSRADFVLPDAATVAFDYLSKELFKSK